MTTGNALVENPNSALRPHVVLLGAGATRAAFPDGDATGRRLSLITPEQAESLRAVFVCH